LTYSGRFIHISGHPSATGRAQDRESSPAKDRRSTTEPRNQLKGKGKGKKGKGRGRWERAGKGNTGKVDGWEGKREEEGRKTERENGMKPRKTADSKTAL